MGVIIRLIYASRISVYISFILLPAVRLLYVSGGHPLGGGRIAAGNQLVGARPLAGAPQRHRGA